MTKVIEEEKNHRQDLFVLASSYIGQLKSKSNEMVKEADFHIVAEEPMKNSQESVKVVNGNTNNVNSNSQQGVWGCPTTYLLTIN